MSASTDATSGTQPPATPTESQDPMPSPPSFPDPPTPPNTTCPSLSVCTTLVGTDDHEPLPPAPMVPVPPTPPPSPSSSDHLAAAATTTTTARRHRTRAAAPTAPAATTNPFRRLFSLLPTTTPTSTPLGHRSPAQRAYHASVRALYRRHLGEALAADAAHDAREQAARAERARRHARTEAYVLFGYPSAGVDPDDGEGWWERERERCPARTPANSVCEGEGERVGMGPVRARAVEEALYGFASEGLPRVLLQRLGGVGVRGVEETEL
ncbi:hypothetical protein C8A01DRAFT_35675 [Parachaetomium inaequale]|uniref:Uncharacterized protein n=1 Tax=Parachaetomium inaequale TaxID=2588326 RepID=A0AAN6PGC2_9PEZI|nr:hypothetical protein C8A01DRAFT_35675 [Parachaetomium inaequale]